MELLQQYRAANTVGAPLAAAPLQREGLSREAVASLAGLSLMIACLHLPTVSDGAPYVLNLTTMVVSIATMLVACWGPTGAAVLHGGAAGAGALEAASTRAAAAEPAGRADPTRRRLLVAVTNSISKAVGSASAAA